MRGLKIGMGGSHRQAKSISAGDPGTTGLMGYYKLDGDALDSSGNARHGTPTGATYSAPARIGAAALVAGQVDVANTGLSAEATNWTVAGWFLAGDSNNPDAPSVSGALYSGGDQYMNTFSMASLNTQILDVYTGRRSSLHDLTYHHGCLSRAGDVLVGYIDGIQVGFASAEFANLLANVLSIQTGETSTPVGDVAIYNRALSPAEIAYLAAGNRPGGLV